MFDVLIEKLFPYMNMNYPPSKDRFNKATPISESMMFTQNEIGQQTSLPHDYTATKFYK